MTIGSPPAPTTAAPRPTLSPEHVIQRDGRDYVLYRGLLHLGHQLGLKGITTALVQVPSDLNGMVAIVHATVELAGGTFMGLGDASPGNVTRMMAPHLIRMAETRAKARALRDAVNVGMAAVEELGDGDESGGAPTPAPAASAPAPPVRAPGAMPEGPDGIIVSGRRFSRDEVWRTYSQRRAQALHAGKVTVRDAVAGLVPESALADLVGASQRLKKLVESPPEELPAGGEEDDGRA